MAEIAKSKLSNRKAVLKLIKNQNSVSRAELAKLTGLTRPTVSSIVSELTETGLIRETGKGESSGGKRPIMLELNSDSAYAIGIDLADEFVIRGVVCDLNGEVVRSKDIPYENVFESIRDALIKLTEMLMEGFDKGKIRGIGVAVSGLVDYRKNEIASSTNFDIAQKGLPRLLNRKFDCPVFLENRPVAAALAEKEYGVGQDYRNIVYITSGRGVGAGIISDGKIFRGSFGSSGEIGKMIMPSALDITTADTKDTLEYLTRKTNIIETAEKLKGRKISYEKILELFHAGDEAIEKLVRQNADYLAYAASVLANIINPEAIILGGRPVELGEKYLEYFNITFNKRLASTPLGQSHVILSRFGAFGVAFGGAVIVLHKVINLKA